MGSRWGGLVRLAVLPAAAVPFVVVLACGTIEPVEVTPTPDAAPAPSQTATGTAPTDPPDADGGADGGDAGVIEDVPDAARIVVSRSWKSLSGSTFETTDAGTRITGFTGLNHPMIVPNPEPNIPSDNFTVIATVHAARHCEFGIVGRLQPNGGAAIVTASTWGQKPRPSIGVMGVDHNPSNYDGPLYDVGTFAGRRYRMKLRVDGARYQGKFWRASDPEPGWFGPQATLLETGRRVGFYVYFCYDATIEDMVVTIP